MKVSITLLLFQLVGVTDDEMKAAQKWKGTGVLELMSNTKALVHEYSTTSL